MANPPGWCGATGITDPGDPPEAIPVGGRYEPVMVTPACPHCHNGEVWSVRGPDDIFVGEDFIGGDAEFNAEEFANQLNAAYELGLSHAADG